MRSLTTVVLTLTVLLSAGVVNAELSELDIFTDNACTNLAAQLFDYAGMVACELSQNGATKTSLSGSTFTAIAYNASTCTGVSTTYSYTKGTCLPSISGTYGKYVGSSKCNINSWGATFYNDSACTNAVNSGNFGLATCTVGRPDGSQGSTQVAMTSTQLTVSACSDKACSTSCSSAVAYTLGTCTATPAGTTNGAYVIYTSLGVPCSAASKAVAPLSAALAVGLWVAAYLLRS